MSTNSLFDVLVIGGGASGMIAAGRAAERGKRVMLIEKNKRLGEKLRITGGGRCNITNAEFNNRLLLPHYGKAEQFLYSLFSQFSVKDTFDFFESKELPLVVEARNRAFPASQKASDVVAVLTHYMTSHNVTVIKGVAVKKVQMTNNRIVAIELKDGTIHSASSYIFATGSISHPETGSTGDGFSWLRSAGHTISEPTPNIVPLKSDTDWVQTLAGVKLENVKVTFICENVKQFALRGDILCTHFGLSGPLILNNAHRVADLLHAGAVSAEIDLFPAQDLGAVERTLLTIFDTNKNKTFKNIVHEFLPVGTKRGVLVALESIIAGDTKVHSISKEQRKKIVQLLKSMPLNINGLMGFDRAVVADGGVAITEIDFKTMRSKKIDNLFVTGDLLHINRPSGGYSLQLCWSTGYVAGSHS